MIRIKIDNKKAIKEIQRIKVETNRILNEVMKSIAEDLLIYSYRDFKYASFYYHLFDGVIL